MRVLKVEPMREPYEIDIDPGLEPLQKEVEGYIEVMYPSRDRIGIVCNEEGKLNGMELNRTILDDDGCRLDIIAGPFLVVGLGGEDFASLPDGMMQKYKEQFRQAELFMFDQISNEITSVRMDAAKPDARPLEIEREDDPMR